MGSMDSCKAFRPCGFSYGAPASTATEIYVRKRRIRGAATKLVLVLFQPLMFAACHNRISVAPPRKRWVAEVVAVAAVKHS